jgi:hypothetical protein
MLMATATAAVSTCMWVTLCDHASGERTVPGVGVAIQRAAGVFLADMHFRPLPRPARSVRKPLTLMSGRVRAGTRIAGWQVVTHGMSRSPRSLVSDVADATTRIQPASPAAFDFLFLRVFSSQGVDFVLKTVPGVYVIVTQ